MDNYSRRKGTVIVFLSARCDVTQSQFPVIQQVAESVRFEEILTVGVCSKADETGEELRTFLQNHGCTFPVYRDPSKAALARFGASFTPEFFLIDTEGKLVYHGGLGTKESGLQAALQDLLADKPARISSAPVEGTPLDQRGTPRQIPDPYGSIAFSSQLIFTKIPEAAAHHCSTLAEASNGDILSLWYGGSYESAEDQALYFSRLKKGECAWSNPERLVWNPEYPPGNAVIFRFPDGRIGILWGRMESPRPIRRGSGWGECRLMQRISGDHGQTWSEDSEVEGGFSWLPRNAPFTFRDGTFAVPLSGRVGDQRGSFLLLLNPDGKTWRPSGMILGGRQPTAIEKEDGGLLCLLRSQPWIHRSESEDGGQTWTPLEPATLKCPDSGIALVRLASGRLLLVHNDADSEERTPLALIQSRDGGKTWGERRILESDPGEYSYPCIIQASDGMIHLSYTYRRYSIKHVTFNENWLDWMDRPN
jgi:predicted neuraminidase